MRILFVGDVVGRSGRTAAAGFGEIHHRAMGVAGQVRALSERDVARRDERGRALLVGVRATLVRDGFLFVGLREHAL